MQGEPLLHPQFEEMLEYIPDKFPTVSFSTNGILLTSKLIRVIADGGMINSIGISIHAELEKVREMVKELVKCRKSHRRPIVGISINIGEFGDNTKETVEFMRGIADTIGIIPLIKDMKWVDIPLGSQWKESSMCGFVNRYVAVLWDGRVTICCRDIGGEAARLSVLNGGITGVWNSKEYKRLRESTVKNGFPDDLLCNRCQLWKRVPSSIKG